MEIIKERKIETSPSILWSVLTKPEHMEKWLGVKVESNWKVNDDIFFHFSWKGKDYVDKGKLIGFDKSRLFVYTYWSHFSGLPDKPENYSKIRFELIGNGNATIMKLIHSEIKNQTMYEHSDNNWEGTLDEIKKIAELLK